MSWSNKLYEPALAFLKQYEKLMGEQPPKSNKAYWDLRYALDAVYKSNTTVRTKKGRQNLTNASMRIRILLVQVLLSCMRVSYTENDSTAVVAEVRVADNVYKILIAFKNNGAVRHMCITRQGKEIGPEEAQALYISYRGGQLANVRNFY